jgi:thermitase
LALCLLMVSGVSGRALADPEEGDCALDQVIVELKPGKKITQINDLYGAPATKAKKFKGDGNVYLLELPADNSGAEATAEKIRKKEKAKGVLHAEANHVIQSHEGLGRFRARGVSDVAPSPQEYAASALNLSTAHAISQGEGTTVAVLDTGVQFDHPALQANFAGVSRYDFVDDDADPSDHPVGLDANANGLDDELVGHGTHVAGIVHQVAPDAKIMPLRVLNTEGCGDVFHIAEAVSYAQNNGAHVINLSLGSLYRSKLLQEVIQDAIKSDVVVAAAAGNDDSYTQVFPAADSGGRAAADGIVAVTALDENEQKWVEKDEGGVIIGGANYGIWVDIAAPGDDIRSAFPVSKYAYWSGTSMATPFVAGQAALIRADDDSLDPVGVEEKIHCSARQLDLHDPVYGPLLGAGHADVGASLSLGACPGKKKAGGPTGSAHKMGGR